LQFVYGTDAHVGRHGTTRRRRRYSSVILVIVVVLTVVVGQVVGLGLVLQLSLLNPHGEKAES
jgi:Na+(H+)/acetate symporter ActP